MSQVQEVGEYYLRHTDVASRLGNMDPAELLKLIRAGRFGTKVHRPPGSRFFLVPMSGFNAFCAAGELFDAGTGELKPIYARTTEELDRKMRALRSTRAKEAKPA